MKKAILLLSLLWTAGIAAQSRIGWEKSYGGSLQEQANAVLQTADGGYIAAGKSNSSDGDVSGNHGADDYWVVKTDAAGNIQWAQNYGGSADDRAEDIRQTADGGYIVAGGSRSADGDVGGNQGGWDVWILKLDAAGNIQWTQNYGGGGSDFAYSIRQTADGGYIAAGGAQFAGGDVGGNQGQSDYWVIKLDADGNIQWEQNYGGASSDNAFSIEPTTDGGYVMAGMTQSNNGDVGGNNGAQEFWVVKINATGAIQWEQNYGGSNSEYPREIRQTADGGFVVVGSAHSSDGDVGENYGISDYWILKLDAAGAIQWQKVYGGSSYDEAESIAQATDGGYLVVGYTRTPPGGGGGTAIDDVWLLRLDAAGDLLWEERYGGIGIEQALSVQPTSDNGFVVGGMSEFPTGDVSGNNGSLDVWIIKLSPLPGSIQGYVYLDGNANCANDSGEGALAGIILTAENALTGDLLYGYTNAQGHFLIEADTVPYLLSYHPPSPLYGSPVCSPNGQQVDLSGSNPNGSLDFYVLPQIFCPYLDVDIATPVLRRCFDSNYHLSYCNNGTLTAEDAFVEVSFAPEITVTGASIPWSSVNGNTYTFQLGDIAALDCGQFIVMVSVDCDSTYIGQTLCVEAHIYPDTVCVPVAGWNGAELEATAACIGTDSVELTLRNVGAGDMLQAVPFLVIEDIIMRDAGSIQLNSQESETWIFPINGLTQRISAQQPADHPFKTFTSAAVNLCNTAGLPPLPGPIEDFYTVYPDDEEEPFLAVDCQQISGAFDPNDKSVHPKGATPEGFITATTELTYKIRFQNTGNDTAFTVVLLDTLAPHLDVATLRPGASSHPYALDIYGGGILKFTFANILLPDSAANEPASHGFVQFTVKQREGNPAGTVILNRAGIYFDYNPAIVTNQVRNTIGKIYIEGSVSTGEIDGKRVALRTFPNPAVDYITFALDEAPAGFELLLYDVRGKLMQRIITTGDTATLYRNSMPGGVYFFAIRSGGVAVANGKVVFE